MSRALSRLTLELHKKAVQTLVETFQDDIRRIEQTLEAIKIQEGMHPTYIHAPIQPAPDFSALKTGAKREELPALVRKSKQAPQLIAMEGPLTEEPEEGTPILWGQYQNAVPKPGYWRAYNHMKEALANGWIYPLTVGGVAGAFAGYKPEPNT